MITVFIGPPGSGKGTQARIMADKLGIRHLSSGDVLRSQVEQKTPEGLKAQQFMQRGELVPNSIIISMILNLLDDSGVILDGFPREIEQAHALDKALKQRGRSVTAAVLFNIAEEQIVQRLSQRLHCVHCNKQFNSASAPPEKEGQCDSCNSQLAKREDDQPAVIRQRFKIYKRQTEPLADHYRSKGVLTEVNAADPVETVHNTVAQAFREVQQA